MALRLGLIRTVKAMLLLVWPEQGNPKRLQSAILVAMVVLVLLIDVGVSFLNNLWNRYFFDALEKRSVDEVSLLAAAFLGIVAAAGITSAASFWFRQRLCLVWRQLVTERLKASWLSSNVFYRMTVMPGIAQFPEQRISEDARLAVEPIVDLTSGFATAALNLIMFSGVLWVAGGSAKVLGVDVPGAMFFAAISYALLMSALMIIVGGKLATRIAARSQAEASYRYALTRVRENSESIALLGAGQAEDRSLSAEFARVIDRWLEYARTWSAMTIVIAASGTASAIVPVLLMAPKYLSGEVSLGTITQVAAAFGTVQGAAGWFTSNFAGLSQWYASAGRVIELVDSMSLARDERGAQSQIRILESPDEKIRLASVAVDLHSGERLIAEANVEIGPGEMTLIEGASGTGKSTLLRAMAGIWPWGSGTVLVPKNAKIMFVPQRPYLPHDTLAATLAYPAAADQFSEEDLAAALADTGLSELVPSLQSHVVEMWDRKLSGGEQQRMSIARLLLHKPDIAFLDEATSALDEASQVKMMELFLTRLFGTTLVSVAHRQSLARYHERRIFLRQDDAHVTIAERIAAHDTSWQGLRRTLQKLRSAGQSVQASIPVATIGSAISTREPA